jgi:hypothetical protein
MGSGKALENGGEVSEMERVRVEERGIAGEGDAGYEAR